MPTLFPVTAMTVPVLKKAGIDHCRAILALSDNDADNAFVVLSA